LGGGKGGVGWGSRGEARGKLGTEGGYARGGQEWVHLWKGQEEGRKEVWKNRKIQERGEQSNVKEKVLVKDLNERE